ncbi:MAG TPA: OB-fold domain-containing protein [Acidimicrobiales bacterium]|nr:OB-fold domain-containing protein [Acidimicrobiales bacterium]
MNEEAQEEPTRFEPPVTEFTTPFWDATREQRLLLPWCRSCDEPFWFPRETCPRDLSPDIGWRPAEGHGMVHAVSVMPKAANPLMAGREPYVVALIDLAEGVRMMSTVVDRDPWSVGVGDRVVLAWEPLSDGRQLYVFSRDGAG